MKKTTILWAVAFCFLGAICFASHDAHMGTWKLNEAKSKLSTPAKNTTVVYAAEGDNVKITVDGVNAEGKPAHNEWTGKFDGKDYPVTGDSQADARSYKVVDDHTLEFTNTKGGKVTVNGKVAVSADGKTRTVTTTSTDAAGKKTENTAVYDKQ